MDLKFDRRAILIPVAGLAAGIANGDTYRYREDQRKAMVECLLRDVLEESGGREDAHTLSTPRGKLGRHYFELSRYYEEDNPSSEVCNAYNRSVIKARIKALLAKHSLYEACVAEDQSVVNSISAGYTVTWFGKKGKHLPLQHKHIVVTWVRPRLDYQSMDVTTFIERVITALGKKYPREQVKQTVHAIPLGVLLSSYPHGAMAEDLREHPYQTWDGLLQFVTSRLKGGLK
ncbi:hypothetical protein WELLINGTON_107 [Erwinia phage Wellington]|uniref:Uncharacterized protein n=2 Tax=Wellingtonvirus wellington TaxID=2734153 RepID=A0A1B2IDX0_9CAUD|nr:hypothetical protein BIZ80_gp193 [Erwinia phage vB_EamM_Kwan]YP_009806591.1 hypothetical protein HOT70_gp194 [Erwinia phage Wellington]ANZ49458.1 hypothetical protein KWAN_106 [Erwinia phage vB_EamM_Kwan]AXF51237.1 hypothetical protein WELLINGTON_107 [Erwinia phage Wellington]